LEGVVFEAQMVVTHYFPKTQKGRGLILGIIGRSLKYKKYFFKNDVVTIYANLRINRKHQQSQVVSAWTDGDNQQQQQQNVICMLDN
jgi:Tfp pilus assembly major pilin PilA